LGETVIEVRVTRADPANANMSNGTHALEPRMTDPGR